MCLHPPCSPATLLPGVKSRAIHGSVGSGLGVTRTELIRLKKFGPEFDPINGWIGLDRVEFDRVRVGLDKNYEF